jgi:hypothetical protein
MVGVKEICALLLAGSMGAGSVVAVQQAKAPAAKSRPAKASKPKSVAHPRPAAAALNDCPSFTATLGGVPGPLAPLAVLDAAPTGLSVVAPPLDGASPSDGSGFVLPPGGGGGGETLFPPQPPAPVEVGGVPQPAAWAMMVTGFGLVGLSLRRGQGASEAA